SHPPGVERLDAVADHDGRVAERAVWLRPGGLARRVVRHLVLEEDHPAGLAVPDHLVPLVMLHEEPGRGDVVAVHDHARVSGVGGPADTGAVVSAAAPSVV